MTLNFVSGRNSKSTGWSGGQVGSQGDLVGQEGGMGTLAKGEQSNTLGGKTTSHTFKVIGSEPPVTAPEGGLAISRTGGVILGSSSQQSLGKVTHPLWIPLALTSSTEVRLCTRQFCSLDCAFLEAYLLSISCVPAWRHNEEKHQNKPTKPAPPCLHGI